MHRSLHEDAALALVVADELTLSRSRRRRELRDQLLVTEGATARILAQDAGRRARKGAAVVGAASLLLAPGMTGVAAAADPPHVRPAEEASVPPAPQTPDTPAVGQPDDDPAPGGDEGDPVEDAADAGADDPPDTGDDPAPHDPPVEDDEDPGDGGGDDPGDGDDDGGGDDGGDENADEDDEADDEADDEDAEADDEGADAGEDAVDDDEDAEADEDAVDDAGEDDEGADAGEDAEADEDAVDDEDAGGGLGDVIEEVGEVTQDVLPGEGDDDDQRPGNGPPTTPPGHDEDGDDDDDDEDLVGEAIDVVDEVIEVAPQPRPDPPAHGAPSRPARPAPPAAPSTPAGPAPTPAREPVPAPVTQPVEVIGVPGRVDPVRSPQQVSAPVAPQAQTAPPVRIAVDPAVHPNLAPTPRVIGQEASVEDRIRASQSRPVDALRVDDWSRAVIQAWTRMQAGDVAEEDDIAALDEVADVPTLGWSYQIQAGDSLWTISEAVWGTGDLTASQVEATWQLLYTWNADRLGADPDTIPSGTVIQIPIDTGA